MKRTEKLERTREKLVDATEILMAECMRPTEVTSRAIASNAGVPLAMINYCFGSREELLFEAFKRKEKEYKSDPRIQAILVSEMPPKEKLRQLHYLVAAFFVQEYKFAKAITGYVLLHRDLSQELNSLPLVMAHYVGRKSETECKMIAYELSSVMQLSLFRQEDIHQLLGYDFTDKEQLHHYIDLQIDLFLEG